MEPAVTSQPHPVPVKFGIVSPARWATALVESVEHSRWLTLAGTTSRTLKTSQAFAGRFGGKIFSCYEDLLADPEIEAVVLATPHFLHHNQAMAAMRAGKHVFVEKPMANTVEEARAMHDLSIENNLVLGVGQQLRRTGAARKTMALIEKGRLGEILLVRGALGATLIQYYKSGDWELDANKIPGGPLDNLAVHYVDLMHYLLGPIVKVSGLLTDRLSPSRVPSAAVASLLFANGVIGELATHQASAYVSELSIYGSKGVLHFRRAGHELWIQEIMDPAEAKKSPPKLIALEIEGPLPHTGALKEELEDFARCVREGGQPEVGGPEGIAALRVVRAVMESHHSGRIVELTPNV